MIIETTHFGDWLHMRASPSRPSMESCRTICWWLSLPRMPDTIALDWAAFVFGVPRQGRCSDSRTRPLATSPGRHRILGAYWV